MLMSELERNLIDSAVSELVKTESKEIQESREALPCLNSNISIQTIDSRTHPYLGEAPNLSTQHRKSAFILKESVDRLGKTHGVDRLGFLTLTFSEDIRCPREAQRRLNSLFSNVIKNRYGEYVGVMERQKSGRIHYHLLVTLSEDIRTGVDFQAFSNRDYRSAGPYLRSEWAFWRKTAPAYRFGRTELLPVMSNMEAMAKYVGKYVAKHIEARKLEDKGVRLVRYSRGARVGTTRFMFESEGSREWRRKLAMFVQFLETKHETKITTLEDISRILGPKWAYKNRDFILSFP